MGARAASSPQNCKTVYSLTPLCPKYSCCRSLSYITCSCCCAHACPPDEGTPLVLAALTLLASTPLQALGKSDFLPQPQQAEDIHALCCGTSMAFVLLNVHTVLCCLAHASDVKKSRPQPGLEPGTTRTQSEYHTLRPSRLSVPGMVNCATMITTKSQS